MEKANPAIISFPISTHTIDHLSPGSLVPCLQTCEPKHDSHIFCQKGDLLQIYAVDSLEYSAWSYVRNITSNDLGWCPKYAYIEHTSGDSTDTQKKSLWFKKSPKLLERDKEKNSLSRSRSFSNPDSKRPLKRGEKEITNSSSTTSNAKSNTGEDTKHANHNLSIMAAGVSNVKKPPSPSLPISILERRRSSDRSVHPSDEKPHLHHTPSLFQKQGDTQIDQDGIIIIESGGQEPSVSFGIVPNRIWSEHGVTYVTDNKSRRSTAPVGAFKYGLEGFSSSKFLA
jgi:hypothetical protein